MAALGAPKFEAALERLRKKIGKPAVVRVGWLEDAHYPAAFGGASVPMVAAIQEFGAPGRGIPARPFFRTMIAEKQDSWSNLIVSMLKKNDWDAEKTLALFGLGVESQLKASIMALTSPPLSPITLMLRKMRSEDQSLVVTGAIVGEAARRVAAGESTAGVSTKPLEYTYLMRDSIKSEVRPA